MECPDRPRLAFALGCALLLSLVPVPVLAHPGGGSSTVDLLRSLNRQLLIVASIIALIVEATLFYAIYRFRGNENPKPTPENKRLEITWTVLTAIVLLFVGVASYQVMTAPDVTTTPQQAVTVPNDAVVVEVTGRQWAWNVTYPEENVTLSDADTLYLPTSRPVYVFVETRDVIHSFHVPALGLKQDAIPGQRNVIRTRIRQQGRYRLYCAEFCGEGHPNMTATVVTVGPREFDQWIEQRRAENATATGSDSERATAPERNREGTAVPAVTTASPRRTAR